MRVFVTGASGYLGSAVVPELLRAGHSVVGLARSDAAAATIAAAGADVHPGSLDDLDALRTAAAAADGVLHLAFVHDFTRYEEAGRTDARAIDALGAALAGSGKPLVVAAGVFGLATAGTATEDDAPVLQPRISEQTVLPYADQGVRTAVVRLAPTVHGAGDQGFVPTLIAVARERGVSGYVGDGTNTWPAVHRLDAAVLFRRAVESAPAGSVLHGVAEPGVPTRDIAAAIGAGLGLPVASVEPDRAEEHFGWLGRFFAMGTRASSTRTQQLLDWQPTHPGLLDDLASGSYTASR